MAKKKTWIDKLNEKKEAKVKRTETDFADIPAGSNMLIATPQLIEQYIREIAPGKRIDTKTMRKDLALSNNADYTCPVTTGIFLRTVAEANYEKLQRGEPLDRITPFWRAIDPLGALAKKLSFGKDFISEQLNKEAE